MLLTNFSLKLVLALLLAVVSSFAWNTKGLVDCNGLFLLDQKDRSISGYGCVASDSTQMKNWMVQGGYGLMGFNADWKYEGMNEYYSWTLSAKKEMRLGYASVQTDYRHLNFRLDVASLPFFMASARWYALDSVIFAGAYYGRGELDSIHIKWKSAATLNVIPVVEGNFENSFRFRRFVVGSRIGSHQFGFGLTYGDSDPETGREGYVFSDSSRFWAVDPSYSFSSYPHEVSLDYLYIYGDQNFFALLREDGGEKRFLFLPVGLDVNFFNLKYKRHSYMDRKKDSFLEAHALYGQLELTIPWDGRRFYETMAPNRALTGSIIKTLSFSVYNRSFRFYGSGIARFVDGGLEYDWDVGSVGWHLKPKLSLDVFYANIDVDMRKRTETSNVLYADHYTDTLSWNFDVVGSMLGAGLGVESPRRRFFASMEASQVIPFYYNLEKYPPVKATVVVPEEDPNNPVVEEVPNVSEDDVSNINKFFRLLRNGFVTRVKVGVFF